MGVVAEDLGGVSVGTLLQFEADLALDGRVEEALPCIVDCELKMRGPVAWPAKNAGTQERRGPDGIKLDEEIEDRLGYAAADGQHAMRGDGLYGLAVVVIHLELLLLVDGVGGSLAD